MKYSLEAKVTGNVIIGSQLRRIQGDREYILLPDDRGMLASIKIITTVKNPEKFSSRFGPGQGLSAATITIEGDPNLRSELIVELQEMESDLSFYTNGALNYINWETIKDEYMPETEEERKQNPIIGFTLSREYPKATWKIDQKSYNKFIQERNVYRPLTILKAFFREGMNEFNLRKYINAFYHFYFILEDLYGQGKTKNKDVLESMIASAEFRKSLEWVYSNFIHDGEENRHEINLRKFCADESIVFDISGLIELLIRVRGRLHHYSSKSSKYVGTPFNHDDYESIAFLAMGLAVHSIVIKTIELQRQ